MKIMTSCGYNNIKLFFFLYNEEVLMGRGGNTISSQTINFFFLKETEKKIFFINLSKEEKKSF